MKRLITIIFLALTLVGAFYFWPLEKNTVQVQPKKVVSENRKLFLGKRKKISTQEASVVSSCETLLNQLNELDMSEEVPLEVEKLSYDGCESEKIKQVKEACAKKTPMCVIELTLLRSQLRTKGVEFSTDKEMIADLILAEFGKKTPDFKKLEKLVNELLNQHPENQTYQKLWAMNKLISNIEKKPLPAGLQDEIYSRLDPEVLNNPDLMSYRLFLETGLNPNKAEAFARSLLEQFPNRPDAYEALGWSLWQQNRRGEAIAQLEKAISLNSKDQWLKDMYSRVKVPNASQETFQGRMNMGVRIEDLYQ